jgi:transposase
MALKVFKFGGLEPTSGLDELRQQIYSGRHYYNKLVKLEVRRRNIFNKMLCGANEDLERMVAEETALKDRKDELRKEANEKRIEKRSKAQNPEAKAEIKKINDALKTLRPRIKEARVQAKSSVSEARIERVNRAVSSVRRSIYAQHSDDIRWTTLNLLKDSADQSFKKATVKSGERGGRGELKLKKFSHDGVVGGQIKDTTVSDAIEGRAADIRITINDNTRNPESSRKFGTVSLRIGRNDDGFVWCTVPVVFHRELPSDGQIRVAKICQRSVGNRLRYEVDLTIEYQDEQTDTSSLEPGVGIDLGWRKTDNGIRVAMASVDDGEVVVPKSISEKLSYVEDLFSIMCKHFDSAKEMILSQKDWHQFAPKWILSSQRQLGASKIQTEFCNKKSRSVAQVISPWRSQNKLVEVAKNIVGSILSEEERKTIWSDMKRKVKSGEAKDLLPEIGSVDNATWLFLWIRKAEHLYQVASDIRRKALLHRREVYRVFAAKLRTKYKYAVMEELKLTGFATKALPEQGERTSAQTIRKNRNTAAPGEFRDAIVMAFGKNRVIYVDPRNTSKTCVDCGGICQLDAYKVEQTCEHCGCVFDRDKNGAWNILAKASERLRDAPPSLPSRAKKKRRKSLDSKVAAIQDAA